MRFHCDVHRRRDDSGYRVTYTTDGENFRHVDSPSEIPVEAVDKVYVDTISIMHTDGFVELLRRGAEVYYLRRLTLIEKMRQRLGIKSKALMAIDEKWFRRFDEDFLVMRRMVAAFRRLLNMSKAASETEKRMAFFGLVEPDVS